ncbi:hypothetical protein T07_8892 [Trichinella nelsoni]|uniref:Uncharacterized protein n=1 Tax=Trichinella nelsoni TaxID=6336 RepID=A0A0V0S4B4_9BILA|nr:hypothetical protein T07_8892 [Trichinella nelsoni]
MTYTADNRQSALMRAIIHQLFNKSSQQKNIVEEGEDNEKEIGKSISFKDCPQTSSAYDYYIRPNTVGRWTLQSSSPLDENSPIDWWT